MEGLDETSGVDAPSEESEDDGRFELGRSYHRLFTTQPNYIFLAKVTYYLSR